MVLYMGFYCTRILIMSSAVTSAVHVKLSGFVGKAIMLVLTEFVGQYRNMLPGCQNLYRNMSTVSLTE